jgi:hypothetical protein
VNDRANAITAAEADGVFLGAAASAAPTAWTLYAPPGEGPACPLRIAGGGYACAVEFASDATHFHYADGNVRLIDDRARATVYDRRNWVRRWHLDTPTCLASWEGLRLHGQLWSNIPCATVEIVHQFNGVGHINGTDTANSRGFTSSRAARWTQ